MHQGDGAYAIAADGAEYARREEEREAEDAEQVESWLSVLFRR